MTNKSTSKILFSIVALLIVAACSSNNQEGTNFAEFKEDETTAIGVNGYLWRASLDTVTELPIAQVDSGGGVIITDWFINPDAPTERLKMTVYILDRVLRADAIKVSVVRQALTDGVWANAPVLAGTELQIEDAILARARELRVMAIDK